MECRYCQDDLVHCHDVSLEHADGTTECLAGCDLDHALHEWQLTCSALEPPCPCAVEELPPPALVLAGAQLERAA
ncbi:MAG: hypothetical protein ACRD0U_02190 [Acidimicrobiales bacterium]